MVRRSLGWWGSITGAASLGLLALLHSAGAAPLPRQATPAPIDCGVPVNAWGSARADDVDVALLRILTRDLLDPLAIASPVATPPADADVVFLAEIEVVNVGTSVGGVVASDITLQLCDGTVVEPVADETQPALDADSLQPGALQSGWVAFAVPEGDVPVRLIVPVTRPGLTGGRVEFALTAPGTPNAAGADGADVVGGDAVGGDGADGAVATAEGGS